jgi:hypothetical protein
VTLQRPHKVHSSVADSRLFDHLESTWLLRPGPQPGTTWLVFKVDFAFRSALYRSVADLFFSEVVKRMIGAFEGRCREVYGPSSLAAGGERWRAAQGGGGGAAAGQQHSGHRQQLHRPHQHHHLRHEGQQQQQEWEQQEQEQQEREQQQRQPRIEHDPEGRRGGA